MPRVINFEGRKITVPADASDEEVAGIVGGAPAPAAASNPLDNAAPSYENAPDSVIPTAKGAALGFSQGVGNTLANAATIPDRVIETLGGPKGAFTGAVGVPAEALDSLRHPEKTVDFGGEAPNSGARLFGDLLSSAPAMALGPMTGGAAGGALTTPEGGNMGISAGVGGGLGGLLSGLSRVIAPHVAPAVARLREAGATLTPGQIFGGMTKGVEDRVAGLPIVGDWIREAQNRSLEDAGRGAVNRSLAPIGQELPDGLIGQDAIRHAGDTLSAHYDALLPNASTTLDAPFAQTIQHAGQRVDARLPDQMGDQFQGTLGDVYKKLNSTGPMQPSQYSGTAAHEAASDLGAMSRQYSGMGGDATELGRAYGDASGAFRGAIARSNPELGPAISANDEGWANLVRLEDASKAATGNASGRAPGVFSGQQLRTAARAGDHSVRDRATARGDALMQNYAEDMIQVLPSSVADSGSAGRMVLPLLAGGAATISPPVAAGLAAIPAIYNRPVLSLLNNVFARNPGPGATQLGGLISRLGAPGAVNYNQGRK